MATKKAAADVPQRRKYDRGATNQTPSTPAPAAGERAPGTLPGFTSAELHPQIVEALKAFEKANDHYTSALANINGQYLNALVNSPAADQVAALRALF